MWWRASGAGDARREVWGPLRVVWRPAGRLSDRKDCAFVQDRGLRRRLWKM